MSAQTGISWTDSTFNPWMGCTKVSPACDHCYAERDTKRFGRVQWGAGQPRVRTAKSTWAKPKTWNDAPFWECSCGFRGSEPTQSGAIMLGGRPTCPNCLTTELRRARRRVFSASLADWLDNEVPSEWLVDLLDLIRKTPNLDWLLLTKRIGNWRSRLRLAADACWDAEIGGNRDLYDWICTWLGGDAPANVWIGATVIDQPEADRDVPKLLAVPARIRFLSIEPMLGAIDLMPMFEHRAEVHNDTGVQWIICGGESGPHARPMHPDWARSLRDQCATAGVAFHFKQWGEWLGFASDSPCFDFGQDGETIAARVDGTTYGGAWLQDWREPDDISAVSVRVGKAAAGRLLDGVKHNAFPSVPL